MLPKTPLRLLTSLSVYVATTPVSIANAFEWEISNFYLRTSDVFRNPPWRLSYGYLDFNLTNTETNLTAECSAIEDNPPGFFYFNHRRECYLVKAPGNQSVSWRYLASTGELEINQTWTGFGSAPA